jgi:selenocysteine-specific elongation factor
MGKIIGTAGHVDHGKTELIKALTGIDTDRLAEEKERGLTIDLGFAYIDLERSGRVGIIDVPGHERFLKNMLAGVGGMDLAVLVVAANESVMPQTREHFEILRFLRIQHIIVAVSKMDLVDEETLLLVQEEIKDLLSDTPYRDAPVVAYSSVSGEGIDELKKVLDEAVGSIEERDPQSQFTRLAIDRCFDLKGIGTVITGTLLSGTLSEGEEVVILPPGYKTKARQIQEHNEKKKVVHAGERVAVNLPGIEKHMVERGYVITTEDSYSPTQKLLVRIEPTAGGKSIKDMTRVKVYLGSGEYIARLELIGKRRIPAGETFICYLVCENEMVAVRKDRFILRYYSPMHLLGGGVVLDAFPVIKKRFSADALENAEKLADASDDESFLLFLHDTHLPRELLRKRMQLPREAFETVCKTLLSEGRIAHIGDEVISTERLRLLSEKIADRVTRFHEEKPLKKGMDKEQLRASLDMERSTFDALLALVDGIELEKNYVRRKDFSPEFDPEMKKRRSQVLSALKHDPFKPEKIAEDDVVRNLRDEGEIVRVKGGVYFHKDAIEKAKVLIRNGIAKKGALTVGEIKDILHTTRRYAIPLLEYLDSITFTVRKGDVRELGKAARE